MEIYKGNLLFVFHSDEEASQQQKVKEIIDISGSYRLKELKAAWSSLGLKTVIRSGVEYIQIPETIRTNALRKAIAKKFPAPSEIVLKRNKANSLLKTVYEYDHYLFTDVKYVRGPSYQLELCKSDADRIRGILGIVLAYPREITDRYFHSRREQFNFRNGKVIIPRTITRKSLHELLASQSPDKKTVKPPKPSPAEHTKPKAENIGAAAEHRIQASSDRDLPSVNVEYLESLYPPIPDQPLAIHDLPDPVKTSTSRMSQAVPLGNLVPVKMTASVERTQRSLSPVAYLKQLYNDACQICGEAMDLGDGRTMSEVHHIQPLGKHGGPDIIENMIVVCPNHHAMFDRGALSIHMAEKRVLHANTSHLLHGKTITLLHEISPIYMDYHHDRLFRRSQKQSANNKRQGGNDIRSNYGKIVHLLDLQSLERLAVKLESYHQREFNRGLKSLLVSCSPHEEINYNGYRYRITRIE